MPKSRSLTVLLLKGAGAEGHDFLRTDRPEGGDIHPFPLDLGPATIATLFVRRKTPAPPRWADFFADYVTPADLGTVSSSSAVLLMCRGTIWFAVTFGQGRSLLRPEAIVEGFGLRVTLNAVGDESLRSIDKETFDAIAGHSRLQSSQGTDAGEFGLDVERDLLRAVTGAPARQGLGQRLSGMDAIAITAAVSLEQLPELLDRLHEAFLEDTYRRNFAWVDNVRAVRDPELLQALDEQLLASVGEDDLTKTWLAPPQILEWADVRYFSYSDSRTARVFTDIHWRTLLRAIRSHPSADLLKHRRILCFGEDDLLLGDWTAYKCIYAEIDYESGTYILSGGHWYQIAGDFVGEVNRWFSEFPKERGVFPLYNHESEAEYNAAVASASSGRLALLDRRNICYGGGRSSIEFCDLLGIDGELIHVKRYSGSRELSHLFAQGLVSGKLLRIDDSFREALQEEVPPPHWEACRLAEGSVPGRRVTFAVIYRSRGEIILPFFSRISLRQAARELSGFGYSVRLVGIDMEEGRARLERLRHQVT